MSEPVFQRKYESSLYENEKGGITIVGHMTDPIHDIKITLDVSITEFIISNAKLIIARAPGDRCQELCPRIEKLNGIQIKHGFTQFVRDLYGGADGCPNVVNLLLSSVPLAINISWVINMKHGVSPDKVKSTQNKQMKDVCISYQSNEGGE